MNNKATQLPTPQSADCSAPPLPEGVQRGYKAAKIAPPILCAVLLVGAIFYLGPNVLGLLIVFLLFSPCAVTALVFCFAPVAKWRVSRRRHISYPIAIMCTIESVLFLATFIAPLAATPYGRSISTISIYIAIVLGVLIAGAEATCFALQAHLGKKYPQILKEESVELKKLEEKYYFGEDSHVDM